MPAKHGQLSRSRNRDVQCSYIVYQLRTRKQKSDCWFQDSEGILHGSFFDRTTSLDSTVSDNIVHSETEKRANFVRVFYEYYQVER